MMKKMLALLLILFVAGFLFSCSGGDDDDDNDDNDDSADDDDDDTPIDDDDDDDDNDDDSMFPDGTVRVFEQGDDLYIGNNLVFVRYELSAGRYSIYRGPDDPLFENAEARALSNVSIPLKDWRSSRMLQVTWTSHEAVNVLGEGMSITVSRSAKAEAPGLVQTFTVLDDLSCVLSSVRVENNTGKKIKVGAIYPLYANYPDGWLNFGNKRDLRVLSNGTLNYLDFLAPLQAGNHITHSNWSILIHNQQTEQSLSIGYLSYDMAQPIVWYQGMGDLRQTVHADCQYEPAKTVKDGETFDSELMILDFRQPTPFDEVELYADRLKAWLGITTWLEKHPEIGVPIGWNSWSGSGSSGGYGTNIDEPLILDNMYFADDQLRRWGMNYFQIDDGWQDITGDWNVNKTRFPDHGAQNGIEWMLSRAKQLGFQTGLWIEAYNAYEGSQILIDHPEYFGDPLLEAIQGTSLRSLDLTNPDAVAHLKGLIQMLVDWGIQWIKLDFAYLVVETKNWENPNVTRGELYREGIKAIREVINDDIFFLAVSVLGYNYGLVDGDRLTLDTMPVWDGENPSDPFTNQGLKPMYRDSARKYYLHNRIFINHPDLIFFRAHKDTSLPPLTYDQSVTFMSSFAMQGGLMKIGDRLVDLQPEAVDAIRRVTPSYGQSGRPLDMFSRYFPEVWSLPVPDFDEPYHVIGLMNWGSNRDLTVLPFASMPSETREIGLDLAKAGLDPTATYLAYEFWTEEFLGLVSGELALDVPADNTRQVALRTPLGRPQYLGTNRHILGGVKVVYSLDWNESNLTLTGTQEGSVGTTYSPFTHHLAFYIPDGYTFEGVDFGLPADLQINDANTTLTNVQGGKLLDLTFTVEDTDGLVESDQFQQITWQISFE